MASSAATVGAGAGAGGRSVKGPSGATRKFDGSPLRIGILHSRWNTEIITPLVSGVRAALLAAGVQDSNIIVQDVPGAWELPLGVQRMYAASQIQSSQAGAASSSLSAGDLLGGGGSTTDLTAPPGSAGGAAGSTAGDAPFDAIVAIGCLIKGQTMHFEYIADATSHGLMRVQLDAGVPLVLGVLTVLNEGQALERAGVHGDKGNAGEEWGEAAVEMGVKRREWGAGKFL